MMWIDAGVRMNPSLEVRKASGVEVSLNAMLVASYAGDPSVVVPQDRSPGFLSPGKKILLAPVETVVFPSPELAQHVTQVFDALRDSLQSRAGISTTKHRTNITVDY